MLCLYYNFVHFIKGNPPEFTDPLRDIISQKDLNEAMKELRELNKVNGLIQVGTNQRMPDTIFNIKVRFPREGEEIKGEAEVVLVQGDIEIVVKPNIDETFRAKGAPNLSTKGMKHWLKIVLAE